MFKKALKKIILIMLASIILASSYVFLNTGTYAKDSNNGNEKKDYSEETIIVKYKKDVGGIDQFVTNFFNGTTEKSEIGNDKEKVKILKVKKGKTVEETLEKYLHDPDVEYAELDYMCYPSMAEPTDPAYKLIQSAMFNRLHITEAWDYTVGSNEIITAVVDSGIVDGHEDLGNKIIRGFSAIAGMDSTTDSVGHGTSVAGVIGAIPNNGNGGSGITWKGKILAVKVADSNSGWPVSDAVKGLQYASDYGADVINMSWGTVSNSTTLKNAIDNAYNKGCVLVAATGNENTAVNYPAAYPNVIAAGSGSETGKVASSCYGPELDVVGTGSFYTTSRTGNYSTVSGTSFSTPQVAALASLLLSIDSDLTQKQVQDYIQRGASGGGVRIDDNIGYGLINYQKSIELLLQDKQVSAPLDVMDPLEYKSIRGTDITYQIAVSGGVQPYTYTVTNLPQGLTCNDTGLITGTLENAGKVTAVITVKDATNKVVSKQQIFNIYDHNIGLKDTVLSVGTRGESYSHQLMIEGNVVSPYTITMTPDIGLSIDNNGRITGSIARYQNKENKIKFTIYDSNNGYGEISLILYVNDPIGARSIEVITDTIEDGTVNVPYSQQMSCKGGTPPYTWRATRLPAGLSIDIGTGLISGTPTTAGKYIVDISGYDSEFYSLGNRYFELNIKNQNLNEEIEEKVNSLYEVETTPEMKYIKNMEERTKTLTVKQNLDLPEYTIEIKDINEIELTDTKDIGTGSTITIKNQLGNIIQTYKVVVKGDITGEGTVNLFDIVKLINYVFDQEEGFVWDETVKRAGKVTASSGNPRLFDIQRLISYYFDGVDW